ncbi:MAG: DUF808 domain-containing protein [Myxococcota bacterium]
MAGASLLTLIDDIAGLLDDIAGLTKTAAQKSAGVLADDLALNAEQVTGFRPHRELAVVWGVAKGSLLNKAILVPAALLVSALAPWMVTPLLMLGGGFLCFEGLEKVLQKLFPGQHPTEEKPRHPAQGGSAEREKRRIRGAVRTDFILSAEVIVIALGTMTEAPLLQRFGALAAIGLIMTVGVYGLVAGIVKIDDLGLVLQESGSSFVRRMGRGLLGFAPLLMKFLGIAGTIAMFLVGGGIYSHGIPFIHHLAVELGHGLGSWEGLGLILFDGLVGVVVGGIIVAMVTIVQRLRGAPSH